MLLNIFPVWQKYLFCHTHTLHFYTCSNVQYFNANVKDVEKLKLIYHNKLKHKMIKTFFLMIKNIYFTPLKLFDSNLNSKLCVGELISVLFERIHLETAADTDTFTTYCYAKMISWKCSS